MRPSETTELPLVSIVVPAYNQARYLGEAIDSVLAQDYPNVELIVLDDGSTDGTRDVLQRYAGRLHTESHPNMGQAETLNKGWRMARGSILSYLAADDALERGAVRIAVGSLLEHPEVVLTYGDFALIDPSSRLIRQVRTPEYDLRAQAVDLICAPGPGVFLRRCAAEATGDWNGALRQIPDFEYWLRLGLQGSFLRIPEVLARYRVHDASPSFAPVAEARAEEPVKVVAAFYASATLPVALVTEKSRAISNAHVLSARLHLRAGRVNMGLRHLRQAFRLWPKNLLRLRTFRLILNALINRAGHGIFWRLNRLRAFAEKH
jgi:glycosyltransferase involved in cell wall biosynthesis